MYAVIFRAKFRKQDSKYSATAKRMRELAIEKYGCTDFISSNENGYEIAISYWENLEQIKSWKNDKEHMSAQQNGKSNWYESYRVQITEIIKEYDNNT
ncbi:MAG: antibiotic biosynthesis monooxygenase [Gammaproteobacteria bacterium]